MRSVGFVSWGNYRSRSSDVCVSVCVRWREMSVNSPQSHLNFLTQTEEVCLHPSIVVSIVSYYKWGLWGRGLCTCAVHSKAKSEYSVCIIVWWVPAVPQPYCRVYMTCTCEWVVGTKLKLRFCLNTDLDVHREHTSPLKVFEQWNNLRTIASVYYRSGFVVQVSSKISLKCLNRVLSHLNRAVRCKFSWCKCELCLCSSFSDLFIFC